MDNLLCVKCRFPKFQFLLRIWKNIDPPMISNIRLYLMHHPRHHKYFQTFQLLVKRHLKIIIIARSRNFLPFPKLERLLTPYRLVPCVVNFSTTSWRWKNTWKCITKNINVTSVINWCRTNEMSIAIEDLFTKTNGDMAALCVTIAQLISR